MTAHERDAIRLRGTAALFAVIPIMLGFHPEDSLVLVCLRGPQGTVGPVGRADVDAGQEGADRLVAFAAAHADVVALVRYSPLPEDGVLTGLLRRRLGRLGIPVVGVWAVHDGWAVEMGRDGAHRAPIESRDDPAVVHLRAANALAGRSVLPSRRHLVASIAAPVGEAARVARAAFARAAADEPGDADQLADAALEQRANTGCVEVELAARLVRTIDGRTARDRLIARAVREPDLPWVAMLVSLAGLTSDAVASPVCAMLSLVAYRYGDGALAQIAAQRSLDHDPANSLARIMTDVMDRALPPERLTTLLGATDDDPDQADADSTGERTSLTDSRCTKASDASISDTRPLTGSTDT
ncbi:DUF4192 domain-containing protein [Nakamurella flavida]|uniref:DUF4192 domain-containing protein n=1 Tax=Nakamurella flavida TaxID=363630 RepID=A0A938YKI0_9ACTN|nr:DUF4192 domain-containing protein [Nakamurella flavida]MBM9474964.1 DUF4192 domain-containing protein [Nakamurella flavida]MDP9776533.1 hypothetical protein [Nakamurella flavida]